jgi:hypothetical protein
MGDHDTLTKSFKLHSKTPVKPSKTTCPVPGRIVDYFSPVQSNEQRYGSGASTGRVKALDMATSAEVEEGLTHTTVADVSSAELSGQSALAEVTALTLGAGFSSTDTATPTAILELNKLLSWRSALLSQMRQSKNMLPLNVRNETCVDHGGSVVVDLDSDNNCAECKVDEELLNEHDQIELNKAYPQFEACKRRLDALWLEKNVNAPHRHFQLHANDMRVLSNRGGGNCLFHALRQGLRNIACDGQTLTHIELRQNIVDHARSNLDQILHSSSGTLCLNKNVTIHL